MLLIKDIARAIKLTFLSLFAWLFGRPKSSVQIEDNPQPAPACPAGRPEEARTDSPELNMPLPEVAAPAAITEAMGSVPVPVPVPERVVEVSPPAPLPTIVIPMAACRNRRHPVTGEQCRNQVPVRNRTGGCCADCVHTCSGGCGRTIPVFHAYCIVCRKSAVATKPCKGCEATIAFDGPSYCTECGHQCAGPDCTAFVPKRFTYCMAEPCQDAKWQKEHPMPKAFGTTIGAQLAAKKKRDKSERDRALRDSMKGKKQSAPKPGHR